MKPHVSWVLLSKRGTGWPLNPSIDVTVNLTLSRTKAMRRLKKGSRSHRNYPGRLRDWRRTRVIERIGSMAGAETINLLAIRAHSLPTKFSPEAFHQADSSSTGSSRVTDGSAPSSLVTIDGANAKDFDDASGPRTLRMAGGM